MSTDLAVIEAALKAATPGPWAVKEINLGAIGTQDDVLWPWVFATNPMPIPAARGATTGPLIVADLSRRHEEDPEDGIDYAHGGIASIETTDGNYPERDAADANLIANAPTWLAELVERVKVDEAEVERLREQNTRYATRLATYRESMQQQLDPMFATLAAMGEILAGDWSPEAPGEWELNAERVRVLRELLGVTS